jgi:hypothetical protein
VKKAALAAIIALALFGPHARAQAKVSTFEAILGWQAPASSPDPVAEYEAFREVSGGTSYASLGFVSNATTTYVDGPVSSGTYDYIVESVDAQGVTSVPSNTAVVLVPSLPTVAKPTVKFNP